jgi:Predicted integral membrane protein (DUF2269)
MWTPYLFVKLLHVVLAILAVGFTSTFGIIMAGAAPNPQSVPFALRTLQRLQKIAGPSFLGLLITGVLMGWLGDLKWTTLWFIASLGLMLVALGLAMGVARPTLEKQIALLDQTPPPIDELKSLGMRSRKVGMVLSLLALTIICLMVFKPVL